MVFSRLHVVDCVVVVVRERVREEEEEKTIEVSLT